MVHLATYFGSSNWEGYHVGKRVALDIWGLPSDGQYWGRIQGNNPERRCRKSGAPCDHPNQLPEVYMQRVIETYSNPGDNLLVMFGGSGTETVVGHALNRRVTTIEKSEICCQSIRQRIAKGPVRITEERDTRLA